jgi:hypothetical protein
MNLVFEEPIAYMLKVIKLGIKHKAYKDEFNAIRHGDYHSFLALINGPIPFMLKYSNGVISDETNSPKYEIDFEGLLKSQASLKIFYTKCKKEYGNIQDIDISDDIYNKVATFEIALRMHANNSNLLSKNNRFELEEVINLLCNHKKLSNQEREQLQLSRRFLNMVKHYKKQFPTWQEGIVAFLKGYDVLIKHAILVI